METFEKVYCRFCAELKSSEKLLNLDDDEKRNNEILLKLSFLSADYVVVSDRDSLPKTVCFVCYDSLNRAYEFLDKVKKSQEILTTIFTDADASKYDLSDDDRNAFDDLFAEEAIDDDSTDVKPLISPPKDKLAVQIEVKDESKEESDPCSPQDSADNFDQTLNVNDIIDAAFSTRSTYNIQIYAKELTDLSKKAIKSWKNYPWLCAYCNIEFLDLDMLRSHAKVVHGKCSAFSCIDCRTWKKDDFNGFIKHVRRHRKILR